MISCHSVWHLLIPLSWAKSSIQISQGCVCTRPKRFNRSFLEIIFIPRSSLHKCRAATLIRSICKPSKHVCMTRPVCYWVKKARPPEPRPTCSFTWHRVAWSADSDRRDSAARLTQNLTCAYFVCSSLWGQIQRHSWHLSRWQKQKSHCLHVIGPLLPRENSAQVRTDALACLAANVLYILIITIARDCRAHTSLWAVSLRWVGLNRTRITPQARGSKESCGEL